jgi:cell division protein FtsI (penicillin-binding protein 3)
MDEPQFVLLVLLDEPQAAPDTQGFATAGWNAVPAAGKIIERIATILGVEPKITPVDALRLATQVQAGTIGD